MQKMKIVVKELTVKDAEPIYNALSPKIFKYLKSNYPRSMQEEQRYIKKLISEMKAGVSHYYVYKNRKGKLCGFGGLKIKGAYAELSLWVREELWGRGIGHFILKHLIRKSTKLRKQPIIACYKLNRRAIGLYTHLKFKKITKVDQIIAMFGRYDNKLCYFTS